MLREKFPEFCSSPSPPIEGRSGLGGGGRLRKVLPSRSRGFPCSPAGIAAVGRVGPGLRGEEGSGCSGLWMAVVSRHLSPAVH